MVFGCHNDLVVGVDVSVVSGLRPVRNSSVEPSLMTQRPRLPDTVEATDRY